MELSKDIQHYIGLVSAYFLMILSAISFLLNPLTNDWRIYQGVAKLTDFYNGNIDLAWEIKPIANRGLNYILYKISSVFAPFATEEYELVMKLFVVFLIVAICYYFGKKCNKWYVFPLSAFLILSTSNFMQGQAEWFALIFVLLSCALFLENNEVLWLISGFVITTIFMFKGITILFVIPIICFVILNKERDWLKRLVIGFVGSVCFLILCINLFPHMIPDMLLSAAIAKVGAYNPIFMLNALWVNLVISLIWIPCIFGGLLAGAIVTYNLYKKNLKWYLVVVMWVACFAIIYGQSEFFINHYLVLILPIILTLYLTPTKWLMILVLITGILFVFASSHWGIAMSVENEFWENQGLWHKEMKKAIPDLQDQNTMLYLDPGFSTYYIGVNSSCRYSAPLPFQRNNLTWDMTNLEAYQDCKVCMMNYTGKYIIADVRGWMRRDHPDNEMVWKKIESEYSIVWNKSWYVYEKNTI